VAAAGEAVRIWASGHIEKTRSLATGGPYAHSRNPLYFGSVLMALGVAIASASPWVILALVVYLVAFYPAVVRSEAAYLMHKFPREYEEWSRTVPLFLPRLTPGGPRLSRFECARVRMNREWRTALAVPVVALLLLLRTLL
jgi:protein-S-isoprenylcysteine O-methyltransferase Ste14